MRTRSPNPFLPRRQPVLPIRWRKGPLAHNLTEPSLDVNPYDVATDLPSGRDRGGSSGKVPKRRAGIKVAADVAADKNRASVHVETGKLSNARRSFFVESYSGWGSNLDAVPLAHGPVGCSNYPWTDRLNLPGFLQGIESFTALNACTDLGREDIEAGGDRRLSKAIEEIQTLFPLAEGITVLNEDPIAIIPANPQAVAQSCSRASDKLIVSLACESVRVEHHRVLNIASALNAAGKRRPTVSSTSRDVAVTFGRTAPALVWIVSKLLHDIGLNPIHELTGSSTRDMARIARCKIVIGFADVARFSPSPARLLQNWFGIPVVWTSFVNPAATDASLRLIAAQFGPEVQERAENIIALNHKKVDRAVCTYRPRLEHKLLLDFWPMPDAALEPYRLLGMRIGTSKGWPGTTGVWRTPRLVFDPEYPTDKALDSYVTEARPDIVLCFNRTEFEWHKRGQGALSLTPFFTHDGDAYWGYDGFLLFAAILDRAINAPWRKFVKPPWPADSG